MKLPTDFRITRCLHDVLSAHTDFSAGIRNCIGKQCCYRAVFFQYFQGDGRGSTAFLVGLDVSNDDVRHLRLGTTTSATARAGFLLIPVGTFRGEVVRFST